MPEQPTAPTPADLQDIVGHDCQAAFAAGWLAGSDRRAAQPSPNDVVDEIVTMLDARALTQLR